MLQARNQAQAHAVISLKDDLLQPMVATEEAHAPVLDRLADALKKRMQACAPTPDGGNSVSRPFEAAKPPAIGMLAYVLRLAKYTGCASTSFVYAFSYIQKLEDEVMVTALTAHRRVPMCLGVCNKLATVVSSQASLTLPHNAIHKMQSHS